MNIWGIIIATLVIGVMVFIGFNSNKNSGNSEKPSQPKS